jgi:hypothetical protein
LIFIEYKYTQKSDYGYRGTLNQYE